MLLAIDPGPEYSAFVWMDPDTQKLVEFGKWENAKLRRWVREQGAVDRPSQYLAIEMIASYGMAVGREVFQTCVWVGRYLECWGNETQLVYRQEVKLNLCKSARATDANIRAALIDRFSDGRGKDVAVGTKRAPGPLFGVSADVWAALGVAMTWCDQHGIGPPIAVPRGTSLTTEAA